MDQLLKPISRPHISERDDETGQQLVYASKRSRRAD